MAEGKIHSGGFHLDKWMEAQHGNGNLAPQLALCWTDRSTASIIGAAAAWSMLLQQQRQTPPIVMDGWK